MLNERHVGALVGNQIRMLEDPDTGKRIPRPNPPEEWKRGGGGGVSVKDRDHGRVRGHCSTRRESGSCGNARVFHTCDIERSGLAGVKHCPKAPALLMEFAETDQRERECLAAATYRWRWDLERKHAGTKWDLDRARRDYESERLAE